MFACAVAAVYQGHRRVERSQSRCALFRVTQHNDICVAAHRTDRISQRLPFGDRARRRIGNGENPAAQSKHRRLERQPGARTRLIEEGRHQPAVADGSVLGGGGPDLRRQRKEVCVLSRGKIERINNMPATALGVTCRFVHVKKLSYTTHRSNGKVRCIREVKRVPTGRIDKASAGTNMPVLRQERVLLASVSAIKQSPSIVVVGLNPALLGGEAYV